MQDVSDHDTSAKGIQAPTRATERAKNIFVTLSATGSVLGLLVAIIADRLLK